MIIKKIQIKQGVDALTVVIITKQAVILKEISQSKQRKKSTICPGKNGMTIQESVQNTGKDGFVLKKKQKQMGGGKRINDGNCRYSSPFLR